MAALRPPSPPQPQNQTSDQLNGPEAVNLLLLVGYMVTKSKKKKNPTRTTSVGGGAGGRPDEFSSPV